MIFFIFGSGYTGKAFSILHSNVVFGTTRKLNCFSNLERYNIYPILFNGKKFSDALINSLKESTHLIISIPPNKEEGDIVYSLISKQEKIFLNIKWIGYLSTVGVYGNHNGKWIDEKTVCFGKKERIYAEKQWIEFSKKNNIMLSILRLGGIYGPGRNIFLKLKKGNILNVNKSNQFFNHIHIDDIIGVINFLSSKNISGIFNICDSTPSSSEEIIEFTSNLMKIDIPPKIFLEEIKNHKIKSYYCNNRRVSNKKIIEVGYKFIHPNYKNALKDMWNNYQL